MVQEEETRRNLATSYLANIPSPAALQRFHAALSAFSLTDEEVLERPPKGFSKCPVQEIDEYFEVVAKVGRPLFKWDIIRRAFLWKLERVMSEMLCVEAENAITEDDKKTMISDEELRQQRQFIMEKATEFDGTPFTFQRLCELITTPSRHYKRTDKYLRALEKNINVVTTITENGERVTGAEPFQEELNTAATHHIEQPFFVQVDECDTPIEAKLIAAGDRFNRENGSPGTIAKEMAAGDSFPINLSPSRDTKEEPSEIKQEDNSEHAAEGSSTSTESADNPEEAQNTKPEQMEVAEE